jgi:DeoR/GlpR family transcriptional regulator of sugar metabolism
VRPSATEAPIAERAQHNVRFKEDIARAVCSRLCAGQTVFIDAGTTTALLARQLAGLSGLTIITNAFDVALALRQPEGRSRHQVIMLGGELGERAAATVAARSCHPPLPGRHRLLSPVGVSCDMGASNYDHHEAEVARAMSEQADQTFILADASKLGVSSRFSLCRAEAIDLLVSNRQDARHQPARHWQRRWESCGWYKAVLTDTKIAYANK